MGQYYLTGNLDTGEYIFSRSIGGGVMLCEIVHNGVELSVNHLLTILLATGNGRGNGDLPETRAILDHHGYSDAMRAAGYPTNERMRARIRSKFEKYGFPVSDTHHYDIDAMVGRWKGCRIAVIGDYATFEDLGWDAPPAWVVSPPDTDAPSTPYHCFVTNGVDVSRALLPLYERVNRATYELTEGALRSQLWPNTAQWDEALVMWPPKGRAWWDIANSLGLIKPNVVPTMDRLRSVQVTSRPALATTPPPVRRVRGL